MRAENIKVGDVLKIREWDDMEEEFGRSSYSHIYIENDMEFFVDTMRKLCGKKFTVKQIVHGRVTYIESEEGVEKDYNITAGMLEPYEYQNDIYVASDDDLYALLT